MTIPLNHMPKSNRNQHVNIMRNEGKTMQEIADFFDISRQRVHQILQA